jgi:hypothetical protein
MACTFAAAGYCEVECVKSEGPTTVCDYLAAPIEHTVGRRLRFVWSNTPFFEPDSAPGSPRFSHVACGVVRRRRAPQLLKDAAPPKVLR